MPTSLSSLYTAISNDPGLQDGTSTAQMNHGLDSTADLDQLLCDQIDALGANDDGMITPEDMVAISASVQGDPADYLFFLDAHGDDEGGTETGFHLLQSDGGSLMFQGRSFVDTVADAIFHYGFDIVDGRYLNEDGNTNEEVADVAGWLNYFVNGVNVVFGSAGSDELSSGDYSSIFADAANETFMADDGNDNIWADVGNDTVWAGRGNDKSGGGLGDDTLYGEDGADTLWGDDGKDLADGGAGRDTIGTGTGNDKALGGGNGDTIYGEEGRDNLKGDAGNDVVSGGSENDTLAGGANRDTIYGDAGDDSLSGDDGADSVMGGEGTDTLWGDTGNDMLSGGEGADTIWGGAGSDQITLWESTQSRDTLVFKAGDSGKTTSTIDTVEGFDSGVDKIDLRSFDGMVFETLDYRGGGTASCYFDGTMLRIDGDGDAVTDMIIEFRWQDQIGAGDLLLA